MLRGISTVTSLSLPFPVHPDALAALRGGRYAFGELFNVVQVLLWSSLFGAMLFLLLLIVVRWQWLAAVLFGATWAGLLYLAIASWFGSQFAPLGIVLGVFAAATMVILLIRFGLLSVTAFFVVYRGMSSYPATADPAAPHFAASLVFPIAVLALAAYAAYIASAARRLHGDEIAPERVP